MQAEGPLEPRAEEKAVQGTVILIVPNFTAGVLRPLLPSVSVILGQKGCEEKYRLPKKCPYWGRWACRRSLWEGSKVQELGRSLGETPGRDTESVLQTVSLGRAQQRASPQADGVELGAFQTKQNLGEVLEREKLILGEEDLG